MIVTQDLVEEIVKKQKFSTIYTILKELHGDEVIRSDDSRYSNISAKISKMLRSKRLKATDMSINPKVVYVPPKV